MKSAIEFNANHPVPINYIERPKIVVSVRLTDNGLGNFLNFTPNKRQQHLLSWRSNFILEDEVLELRFVPSHDYQYQPFLFMVEDLQLIGKLKTFLNENFSELKLLDFGRINP